MRKAKIDRVKSTHELQRIEKRIRNTATSNMALVNDYDVFSYTLTIISDTLFNYMSTTHLALCKEYENKFLLAYKKHCSLMDKVENYLDPKRITKFLTDGAKTIYLKLLKNKIKLNEGYGVDIEKHCQDEKIDLTFYYTILSSIKICDDYMSKIDKEEVIKYYKHVRIELYTILKVIREEYNSDIMEGGRLLLGAR